MNTNPIRVLHIVGGAISGGAARGALNLSNALRERGVDSHVVCSDPRDIDLPPSAETVVSRPLDKLKNEARARGESLPLRLFPNRDGRLFSLGLFGADPTNWEAYNACDIVNLHWINRGMLSIKDIGRIRKPLVLTMRDMWPYTGGCHYSMDCDAYLSGCCSCPALGTKGKDVSTWISNRKLDHFPKDAVYVGISDWVSECARKSYVLGGKDIRTISNTIDIDAFSPVDKMEARKALDLPLDRPILLHGALNISDRYKGLSYLEEAKKLLKTERVFVCTFGHVPAGSSIHSDRNFGMILDDGLLRRVYSAADVLAFPSVQEAFGKVVAEAMACGTPSVVFAETGAAEIIRHKVTGFVAKFGDALNFASGIDWIFDQEETSRQLSSKAIHHMRQRFDGTRSAEQYISIYKELLARKN